MSAPVLNRYRDHQSAICSFLDRIEPLVSGTAAPDPSELGRLRWELTRALIGYQLFKHREIFDAAARRTPARAALAGDLKAECTALGEEYRAHVVRWTSGGTVERWPEHRVAARRMIERIRSHLKREKTHVEVLLSAAPARTPR